MYWFQVIRVVNCKLFSNSDHWREFWSLKNENKNKIDEENYEDARVTPINALESNYSAF